MRRLLIATFASLLAVALIAPAAQGATEIRQVRARLTPTTPPMGEGRLTLEFVFKNKRNNRKRFTPRQVTRIGFESVPLLCLNAPVNPTGTSQLILITTLETKIKLKKAPPPHAAKPKPNRYAFNFSYSFPAFTGTISGKIDKVNGRGKTRYHGWFTIEDLDSDPGHWDCSTHGGRGWAGYVLGPGSWPIYRTGVRPSTRSQ